MGYRSDVECVIYGDEASVDAFIAKDALEAKTLEAFKAHITVYVDDAVDESPPRKLVFMEWSDVKWYTSTHVDAWERLLDDLDDTAGEPGAVQYDFVRVGEDTGDVEERGSCVNERLLYVGRSTERSFDECDGEEFKP